MTTERQALAVARKRYGKNAYTEHRPRAKDKDEKAQAKARYADIRQTRADIKELLMAPEKLLRDLLAAAEFVADVNGDNPSIPALREAVEKTKHALSLAEEYRDLGDESRKLESAMYGYRCNVLVASGVGGFVFGIGKHHGDTWGEVIEQMRTATAIAGN